MWQEQHESKQKNDQINILWVNYSLNLAKYDQNVLFPA